MVYPHIYRKLKRGPQVILPKDIGIILAYTGVSKESICIDAGTGSGWLAVSLARVSRHVYSYELREEFMAIAEKNRKILGLENLTLKLGNVFERIEETDADLVTLDMSNSERALGNAYGALRQGGMIAGYLPHTEQVKTFVEALNAQGFSDAHTVEVILRDFLVRKEGMRPTNMGVWHTAYLVFARK